MSSIGAPKIHSGLKHSKLCLNLCSFKGLNVTRSLVSILTFNTLYITNVVDWVFYRSDDLQQVSLKN